MASIRLAAITQGALTWIMKKKYNYQNVDSFFVEGGSHLNNVGSVVYHEHLVASFGNPHKVLKFAVAHRKDMKNTEQQRFFVIDVRVPCASINIKLFFIYDMRARDALWKSTTRCNIICRVHSIRIFLVYEIHRTIMADP